jgi:hypothetical protein
MRSPIARHKNETLSDETCYLVVEKKRYTQREQQQNLGCDRSED